METSHPFSIESFSYSWLVNIKPSLQSFEDSFKASIDDLDETSLFIHLDPKLPASRRFFKGSCDFKFDFPTFDSPVALVHADELISNGFLMPLVAKSVKIEPYDDMAYSTPSTPVPSHALKNVDFDSKVCCSSFRRCRRFSKRILRKYLKFITHVFQNVEGRSPSSKSESYGKKQDRNRFVFSASNSPRISVAYSVDNRQRSCDYESSINEAVLHCKRSVGK